MKQRPTLVIQQVTVGFGFFFVPVRCSGSLHSEEIFCGGSQDVRKMGGLSVYQ